MAELAKSFPEVQTAEAHFEVLAVLDRVVHRDEQVAHVALVRRVQRKELDLGGNSIG